MKQNRSKGIKICPECKSSDIILYMRLSGAMYKCKKCGYHGPLIIEHDENRRAKPKKRRP